MSIIFYLIRVFTTCSVSFKNLFHSLRFIWVLMKILKNTKSCDFTNNVKEVKVTYVVIFGHTNKPVAFRTFITFDNQKSPCQEEAVVSLRYLVQSVISFFCIIRIYCWSSGSTNCRNIFSS